LDRPRLPGGAVQRTHVRGPRPVGGGDPLPRGTLQQALRRAAHGMCAETPVDPVPALARARTLGPHPRRGALIRLAPARYNGTMFGIYIHIPYCRTLCPYCDFVKERTAANVPAPFVDALLREIDGYDGPREATSIFLGGGTPSLLSPGDLDRILKALGQ